MGVAVCVTVGRGTAMEAVAVGGTGVLVGGTVSEGTTGVTDAVAVTVNVKVGVIGVAVGGMVSVGGWKGVTDGGSVMVTEGVRLGPGVAESRFGVPDGPAVTGIIRVRVGVPVSVTVGVAVRAPGSGATNANHHPQQ